MAMRHILISSTCTSRNQYVKKGAWKSMATMQNMFLPDEIFTPDDIGELTRHSNDIESLDIDEPLPEYGFISQFPNLQQLYIYGNTKISNLNFIRPLLFLQHLLIEYSRLESIAPLVDLLEEKKISIGETFDTEIWWKYRVFGIYIASEKKIRDTDHLMPYDRYITEAIINGQHLWRYP